MRKMLCCLSGFATSVCRIKTGLLVVAVVCAAGILPAWPQSAATGTVLGQVTDPSGAVVGKASVMLTDVATNTSRTATTNDAGRYVFVNVAPGVYSITVNKSGFATSKSTTEEVKVGVTSTVDF